MAGVPGSHPSNLANPVPGEDVASRVMTDLANAGAPTPMPEVPVQAEPAVEPPPMDDPLASLAAEYSGAASSDPLAALAQEFSSAPAEAAPQGFLESAQQAVSDYASEVGTMAKTSFARTDAQKQATLEQQYGAGNVRKEGDMFQYKVNGKWKDADRSFWQIYKDLVGVAAGIPGVIGEGLPGLGKGIASSARGLTAEAAALPTEIAATVAAPFAGPGAPVVMVAGRAAGAELGIQATDAIARELGIPDDPNENQMMRHGIEIGGRVILGAAFDKVSKVASAYLGKRAADKAAKQAVVDMIPEQSIVNMTDDIAKADTMLAEAKQLGVLDPNFKMRIDQSVGAPEAKAAAKQASKTQVFRDLVESQGEMLSNAWDKLASGAKALKGKTAKMAENVINGLNSADDAFGALIGTSRDEAIKMNPGYNVNISRTAAALDEARSLGFTPKGSATKAEFDVVTGVVNKPSIIGTEYVPPRVTDVAAATGMKHQDAAAFIKRTKDLLDATASGGGKLPLKQVKQHYEELTGLIGNLIKDPARRPYTAKLIQLKNSLRDDMADGIGEVLGDAGRASYDIGMKRYRVFREAEGVLGSMLDRTEMSTDGLLQYLFTKGSAGNERIGALKRVLDTHNPEMFETLKNAWMKKLMDQNQITGSPAKRLGGYDWAKIRKNVNGIGEDALNQVFSKEEQAKLNSFFNVSEQIQRADFDYVTATAPERKKFAAQLLHGIYKAKDLFHPTSAAKSGADAIDLMSNISPDEMALKFIMNGGDKEILALVPKGRQPEILSFMDKMKERGMRAAERAASSGPLPTNVVVGPATREISERYGQNKPSPLR